MEKKQIKTALMNIESAIKNIEKKDFKLLFFIADSKGAPVGSIEYTYDLAYNLNEMGYTVQMLYADSNFVGVKDWLGEKYAQLPHFNTQNNNISVSPSDFLFIPELFTNVMAKTVDLPCKRIAIIQNFGYLCEAMKYGASLETLKIRDCITGSKSLADRIKEVFPDVKAYVIRPHIYESFKPASAPKLLVNIFAKDETDIDMIIKPFKWKFPLYDFVSFRYIKGRSKEDELKYLKEGAISIWVDERTDFGYTALEAMACGNIIIGKVPDNTPEWMVDKDEQLLDNGVWFYNLRDLPKLLADVIQTLLYDKIPQGLYDDMKKTVAYYSKENHVSDAKAVSEEIIETRTKELALLADALKNNIDKQETKE